MPPPNWLTNTEIIRVCIHNSVHKAHEPLTCVQIIQSILVKYADLYEVMFIKDLSRLHNRPTIISRRNRRLLFCNFVVNALFNDNNAENKDGTCTNKAGNSEPKKDGMLSIIYKGRIYELRYETVILNIQLKTKVSESKY